jgi:hypothetical protein
MISRERKFRRVPLLVLAFVIAGAGGTVAALSGNANANATQWHRVRSATSSHGSQATSVAISTIVQNFVTFADSQSAGGTVSNVQYVSASDGSAVVSGISGESTSANVGPVVALEASGQFVANAAKTPEGVLSPTGTVLTEVVNPADGEVEGWGVSNNMPNLAPYGTVQTAQ